MRVHLLFMLSFLAGHVLARGRQPCENEADPHSGIGNFCACQDRYVPMYTMATLFNSCSYGWHI
ncbi:hypothetical protein BJX68DRAFT_249618 [Aspergillus pseudodeflectus]|uniref:Uncharacterized protein n=1 Tax=Aspergillus pseudodeflectus TaxID=176178 RepID=A0ABR4JCC6_9EURO